MCGEKKERVRPWAWIKEASWARYPVRGWNLLTTMMWMVAVRCSCACKLPAMPRPMCRCKPSQLVDVHETSVRGHIFTLRRRPMKWWDGGQVEVALDQ